MKYYMKSAAITALSIITVFGAGCAEAKPSDQIKASEVASDVTSAVKAVNAAPNRLKQGLLIFLFRLNPLMQARKTAIQLCLARFGSRAKNSQARVSRHLIYPNKPQDIWRRES